MSRTLLATSDPLVVLGHNLGPALHVEDATVHQMEECNLTPACLECIQ